MIIAGYNGAAVTSATGTFDIVTTGRDQTIAGQKVIDSPNGLGMRYTSNYCTHYVKPSVAASPSMTFSHTLPGKSGTFAMTTDVPSYYNTRISVVSAGSISPGNPYVNLSTANVVTKSKSTVSTLARAPTRKLRH